MQRKKYSQEFKEQIIKEVLETGNASLVGRKHGVSKSLVSKWVRDKKTSPEKSLQEAIIRKYPSCSEEPDDFNDALKQNEQLKRLLGERELGIAVLRDLLKKTDTPLPKRLQ